MKGEYRVTSLNGKERVDDVVGRWMKILRQDAPGRGADAFLWTFDYGQKLGQLRALRSGKISILSR